MCNAMTNNLHKIKEISGINSELWKITKQLNIFPISREFQNIIDAQNRINLVIPKIDIPKNLIPNFEFADYKNLVPNFSNYQIPCNTKFFESLNEISKLGEKLSNNPELQFAFITDLEMLNLKSTEELKNSLIEDLSDEQINEKEKILDKNLIPLLSEFNLENLWNGANDSLNSNNPDKLRHSLISLRTILEFLIDDKLAPIDKIKDDEMFADEFKKYHKGKQELEYVKIYRSKKIEYFTNKFEFGFLEEFTKNDVQYICDCYSILCNVHQPNIGITENQVRSLKVKTGITIWLLCYLYKIQQN